MIPVMIPMIPVSTGIIRSPELLGPMAAFLADPSDPSDFINSFQKRQTEEQLGKDPLKPPGSSGSPSNREAHRGLNDPDATGIITGIVTGIIVCGGLQ
jgi:hypothetical protein